jgi:hypothetical protein
MAKLTGTESVWKQPVVHDIFEAGGLLKKSVRTAGSNITARSSASAAKVICDEIKNRAFDFPSTDSALRTIADGYFQPLHARGSKRLTVNQIANILASFCAETEIFWDDINTLRTTVEMETYRKSALGKACWDYKCFLSQQSKKTGTSVRAPRAAGGRRTGAPKSSYKSSGPKSGIIGGLVGEPGEKTILPSGDTLFVLVCDRPTKSKKQYVFIDPLSPIAELNKVRFGDPSGWSSCKIFFESLSLAEEAIRNIESGSFRIPADVVGIHVERQKADPNGYFRVKTDLGEVYIKASKLNEAIEEALTKEKTKPEKRTSRYPEINDVDVYYEAMQRYE